MKKHLNPLALCLAALFFLCSGSASQAQIINTICGIGITGDMGDGGQATAARIMIESGMYVDNMMNVYLAGSENKVRKVNGSTGIISTIVGTGTAAYSGDGGPATAAEMNSPCGITMDAGGNIYVTDIMNHRVRKINATTGIITTVAGGGSGLGEGGPATAASLFGPTAVKFDHSGNMLIADCAMGMIRKVDATTGIITTIAGSMSGGSSGDGGPATAATIDNAYDFCFDAAGNMYISEEGNPSSMSPGHKIRKVDVATGIITTIAGTGTSGYSGDGGAATAAMISSPLSICIDRHGNLLFSDVNNNRIRSINLATGIISTVAGSGVAINNGDGGPVLSAGIFHPMSLFVDTLDRIYIGSELYQIRRTNGGSTLKVDEQVPFISSVYPNPGSGLFHLTFPEASPRVLEVCDAAGRSIKQLNCKSASLELDLRDQPDGIYLVKVSGSVSGVQTVVVRH